MLLSTLDTLSYKCNQYRGPKIRAIFPPQLGEHESNVNTNQSVFSEWGLLSANLYLSLVITLVITWWIQDTDTWIRYNRKQGIREE